MLTVTSNKLELRGISNKETKAGKVYYIINVETEDGTPYGFYCPDASAFEQGLKKGMNVTITFEVKHYQGQEKLVACKVNEAK